jgi:hypothetical protein
MSPPFSALKMEATFTSESQLTSTGLHGVISQKTEAFLTAAVRTSNPTFYILILYQKFIIIMDIYMKDRAVMRHL